MNRLQIDYFLHLCKTLNITETARSLYVAQPSVSKQIAALEKELGYKLFDRSNRGLTLTESGEIMYQFFDECRAKFQIANRDARRLNDHGSGEIIIGILDNLDLSELFDAIDALKEKIPELNVKLIRLGNDELMTRLKDRRLDIAITFDRALLSDQQMQATTLIREECLFLISSKNPLCRDGLPDCAKLNGAVFCHPWTRENRADEFLESLLKKLAIKPNGYVVVENLASGLECVVANHTVALIDERIMLPGPERFKIIPTGEYQEIVATWDLRNRNPVIEPMIQQLLALCKDTP